MPPTDMLKLDTGNTGFMILAASLVMLMTPGLAFFYGGLVGRKNVLAIMIQSFVSMGWTTVLWYSAATRCVSRALTDTAMFWESSAIWTWPVCTGLASTRQPPSATIPFRRSYSSPIK